MSHVEATAAARFRESVRKHAGSVDGYDVIDGEGRGRRPNLQAGGRGTASPPALQPLRNARNISTSALLGWIRLPAATGWGSR
jgi:hypothetical protein